jgi:outer membrane receptor for ferrienterochelin and colicin
MREGGYTQGAEFELKWEPIKNLLLASSYTRTFAEADARSSTSLPRNLFGFNLDWRFWNRFHYHLDFTYNGSEQIALFSVPSFTTKFVDQKSYNKVDMKLSFDLNDYLTLWARGENVFDANIREDGFGNPGAQAFGGVSMEV